MPNVTASSTTTKANSVLEIDLLAPAYLVKGDDETLVADQVSNLVNALAGDDGIDIASEELSAEDVEVSTIIDAASTPPMFTSRRVLVVRQAGHISNDASERLAAYLRAPMATTSLVLVAGGGQISTRLLNAVRQSGHVIDASAPVSKVRTKWVLERIHESGLQFDAHAATELGEHLGEDVGRLRNLLEALLAAYGEGASIGRQELQPFLGEAGAGAPWDLTDAIDRGDISEALIHLHRLMNAGQRHPLVIMSSLHRHFAAMMRLDGAAVHTEQQAADLLGIAPYPAKKAMNQARRLGTQGITRAITLLSEADLNLRGAMAGPTEMVVEILVARLCRVVPKVSSRSAGER